MTEGRANSALLEVEQLSKLYKVGGSFKEKSLRALQGFSLKLHRGECIALVGESGSGKSTVLKLLSRLEAPSGGKLFFQGKEILKEDPRRASLEYRREVQMIFQDPFSSLNPLHSVRHHLARPFLLHRRVKNKDELEAKVLTLLERVELVPAREFANKRPHEMSGGQRQRVAIARALAVEPSLILADEPISMLDVSIRMGVLNLMRDLKNESGVAFLYVTHDLASARYIADRIMVLYAGQVVEEGPAKLLLDEPAHPYTKLLLEAVPKPDGNILRALSAKSGSPQVLDPPPGCSFRQRCPEATNLCAKENPGPISLGKKKATNHFVHCHLFS